MKKERQNKKQNLKDYKGITLIALVVTIIVLLILAAISITAVFGEDGLITRADKAKTKTEEEAAKDAQGIKDLGTKVNEILGVEPEPAENSLLAMYNAGLSCANPESCTDEKHLHIGDYVNYTEPTSGGYKIEASRSGMEYDQYYTLSETVNNLNWRVLGKDKETGGVKLIADSPMKIDENGKETYNCLYFYSAEAYEYGPTEMNNACAIYKNSLAVKARSVNMQDIDEITGKTTDALRGEMSGFTGNGFKSLGSNYSFEKHYTPTRWIEIGKAADSTKAITVAGTTNGYGYCIAKTEEQLENCFAEGVATLVANTRIYNMLFKDLSSKPYWLASRSVIANSDSAYFSVGSVVSIEGYSQASTVCVTSLFGSNGSNTDDYSTGLTVRPVVCLNPTVTVDQIQKIADQPDSWGESGT